MTVLEFAIITRFFTSSKNTGLWETLLVVQPTSRCTKLGGRARKIRVKHLVKEINNNSTSSQLVHSAQLSGSV